MFQNKLEVPCQTINISPGDTAVIASHMPRVGEEVIIYLDNIGRVNGPVVRLFEGGFAMTFDMTMRAREKMVGKIVWCQENAEFGTENQRRHDRVVPRQTISEMRLDDGRAYAIEIIDISLSGAAVRSAVRPALGAKVMVGGMQGKVVRHFDEGIAIEFVTLQENNAIVNRFV
ncbi:PilZ domain-containing protein [Pseudahrensia aquimaris]|uniref:PilZ domain-containing protein n=1 Tax=Pseudahrensia aquimaris TaxID=744461 RepID=A0ABW3FFK6_9HYPH